MSVLMNQQTPATAYSDGFDPAYYRQQNPDVAASAFGQSDQGLYNHYQMYGKAEGRPANATPNVSTGNNNTGATPVPAVPPATTTPPATNPPATTTPPAATPPATTGQPVNQYMGNQVSNPALGAGTEFTPTLQQTQGNELLTGQGSQLNPTGTNESQTTAVTAPNIATNSAQASLASKNPALDPLNPQGSQYDAATGNNAAQGTAEQGKVQKLDTVQGQLTSLYAQMQNGQIPTWAQGSVNAAQEYLAVRNMAPSTIGSTAIFGAIQQSALNIAATDSNTYFQMNMANLNNRQQMAMENLKNRQQGLLSDQSATNAAKQFNSANEQQMQQFMSSMIGNINNQNADRKQAISIFNAQESNKINSANAQYGYEAQTFNAQQKRAINEFNSTLRNQREQFNSQNAFAIEQSNVLWRRSVNTANTAAVNAANQANVQNKFNVSQTALNNVWQQFRDEASWMFTASENEKNRQFNSAMSANNRTFVSSNQPNSLASAVGAFAGQLLL